MGKMRQLSPVLWPLIEVILFSYTELIFRGGVSCLPAALLLHMPKERCRSADQRLCFCYIDSTIPLMATNPSSSLHMSLGRKCLFLVLENKNQKKGNALQPDTP